MIFRLGARIYGIMFFGNASGACLGIFATSVILPEIGYKGVFWFYGILTIISGILLTIFN